MQKKIFCLDDYRTAKPYFKLFDILLKDDAINKDRKLLELGISPSSYRRCREHNQKIGTQIIKTLCEYFKINLITPEDIDYAEELVGRIYEDLMYKIYTNLNEYHEACDRELSKHNLLYPLYNLVKLFLNINSSFFPRHLLNANEDYYLSIVKLHDFYIGPLSRYADLISIYFTKKIDEKDLLEESEEPVYYYILAYRLFFMYRYIDCIFIALKAREVLMKTFNFKRVVIINILLMASYSALGDYEKVTPLAIQQLKMLKSFGYNYVEYENTYLQLAISYVGRGMYEDALEMVKRHKADNQYFLTLKLICYFKTDKKSFKMLYEQYKHLEIFKLIYDYLTEKISFDEIKTLDAVIMLPVLQTLLKRL